MRIASALAGVIAGLSVAAACSRNSDADVQQLIDELSSLDDAVVATVRGSPNAEGIGKAEALVEAKKTSLHDRVVEMNNEKLSTAAAMAFGNACVKNSQNGMIAREYVQNAVLKSDPELVARTNRLADSLCEICVTAPTDSWMCIKFKEPTSGR